MDNIASDASYPGNDSDPNDIMELADAYRDAAMALFEIAPKGESLSYAPARLCSIHAIELYLNAFLRFTGTPAAEIRARMHNLGNDVFAKALGLRKKTAQHLVDMTERREYLISRYAPELASQQSELNRLKATLVEIKTKMANYSSKPGN